MSDLPVEATDAMVDVALEKLFMRRVDTPETAKAMLREAWRVMAEEAKRAALKGEAQP